MLCLVLGGESVTSGLLSASRRALLTGCLEFLLNVHCRRVHLTVPSWLETRPMTEWRLAELGASIKGLQEQLETQALSVPRFSKVRTRDGHSSQDRQRAKSLGECLRE